MGVPLMRRKRVRSTGVRSGGGSKKLAVDGVSAGGTKGWLGDGEYGVGERDCGCGLVVGEGER